jgi:hypothetical protein
MTDADMSDRWTPDHLQTAEDRAIHLAQRREQLHPIVDDLRRLAREMEAAAKEADSIEGDFPGQGKLRAWHVTRPLFKAADDVERALADLVAFNARFQRSYEELPEKRAKKRAEKELAKNGQQALGSSPSGSKSVPSGREAVSGEQDPFGDVFDGLRRGA